jgi:prevent-host-death family protein
MKVSVAEAKNNLPKLIRAAERGQRVTICRHGKSVVDIVRTPKAKKQKPKLGTLRHKTAELDPDWWKPMTSEELSEFLGSDK